MNEFPDAGEPHAACRQEALRQRGRFLTQLAALIPKKRRTGQARLSLGGARRLFLLYPPTGAWSWALHCTFYFFLIATVTGTVRSLLHVAYLRPAILVPLVIGDGVIVVLIRLASLYVDRAAPRSQSNGWLQER